MVKPTKTTESSNKISNLDTLYNIPDKPLTTADSFLLTQGEVKLKPIVFFNRASLHKKKLRRSDVASKFPPKPKIDLTDLAQSQSAAVKIGKILASNQAIKHNQPDTFQYINGGFGQAGLKPDAKKALAQILKNMPKDAYNNPPLPAVSNIPIAPVAPEGPDVSFPGFNVKYNPITAMARARALLEKQSPGAALPERESKSALTPRVPKSQPTSASISPEHSSSASAAAKPKKISAASKTQLIKAAREHGHTPKGIGQLLRLHPLPTKYKDIGFDVLGSFLKSQGISVSGKGVHGSTRAGAGRKPLPAYGIDDAFEQARIMIGEIEAHNDSKVLRSDLADVLQYLYFNHAIEKDLMRDMVKKYVANV